MEHRVVVRNTFQEHSHCNTQIDLRILRFSPDNCTDLHCIQIDACHFNALRLCPLVASSKCTRFFGSAILRHVTNLATLVAFFFELFLVALFFAVASLGTFRLSTVAVLLLLATFGSSMTLLLAKPTHDL